MGGAAGRFSSGDAATRSLRPRADRGGRAARARTGFAQEFSREWIWFEESELAENGGRAGALRGLRLSGPCGELRSEKLRKVVRAEDGGPCVRLLRGRHALDSGTAAALLAAGRE